MDHKIIEASSQLASQPLSPINKACEGWADTKATYRLFGNENLDLAEVLRRHKLKTIERIKKFPVVLAIQDTTYLNYTSHSKTIGLGHIDRQRQDKL